MKNIEMYDAFYGTFDLDDLLDEVVHWVDHDLLEKDQEDNILVIMVCLILTCSIWILLNKVIPSKDLLCLLLQFS